jgi:acetyl esterase
MIHGFFNMIADPVDIDAAHDAYDMVVADLETMLAAE